VVCNVTPLTLSVGLRNRLFRVTKPCVPRQLPSKADYSYESRESDGVGYFKLELTDS